MTAAAKEMGDSVRTNLVTCVVFCSVAAAFSLYPYFLPQHVSAGKANG